MATPHLGITDIVSSQNQKYVTANDAHADLDRAMNGETAKTITGDDSLTTTESRENTLVRLTGSPGSVFNLDMPDTNKRQMSISNSTGQSCTLRNSVGGGVTLAVPDGQTVGFHYDGTDFRQTALLNATNPLDIGFTVVGLPAAGSLVALFVATRAYKLLDDFATSKGWANISATGNSVFDVKKNGSSIGSITFAIATNAPTFSTGGGSDETFAVGDRLEIVAPGVQDATLADLGVTLWGERT